MQDSGAMRRGNAKLYPRRPGQAKRDLRCAIAHRGTHNHRCRCYIRLELQISFTTSIGGYGSRLKAGTTKIGRRIRAMGASVELSEIQIRRNSFAREHTSQRAPGNVAGAAYASGLRISAHCEIGASAHNASSRTELCRPRRDTVPARPSAFRRTTLHGSEPFSNCRRQTLCLLLRIDRCANALTRQPAGRAGPNRRWRKTG